MRGLAPAAVDLGRGRLDGNGDGARFMTRPTPIPPPLACCALTASRDYRRAIFGYNPAEWYVAKVLAKANAYRGAARTGALQPPVADVLDNPQWC